MSTFYRIELKLFRHDLNVFIGLFTRRVIACYDVFLFGVEFYKIADGVRAVPMQELNTNLVILENQQVSSIPYLQVGIIM